MLNRALLRPRARLAGRHRRPQPEITHLQQPITGLRLQLGECDGELVAARAANRELMTQLNAAHHR